MTDLTPKEIVKELDKFVIGQGDAKKAVANALRNRWRRKFVTDDIRDEIIPQNILMIGPTGVGKTEIARRLSKLAKSPFIKVEATKFTEIGYVGRDVDSIIRDLIEIAVKQIKDEMRSVNEDKAKSMAKENIINILVGDGASDDTKRLFSDKFDRGELDDKDIEIELEIKASPSAGHSFDIPGAQVGILSIGDMLEKVVGQKKTKLVKLSVKDAYEELIKQEGEKLLDEENVIKSAIKLAEQDGIVFIDEIDKIVSSSTSKGGRGDVSREGVQRDLLPLIEGTTVNTKYGPVNTHHMLFITSGAFHISKPSDLLAELQGRLPVRVELDALSEEDMLRILKEPAHSLPKQYKSLLAVDNVELDFTDSGLKKIAEIAIKMNMKVENIGARRLHTIMEKLLEPISFTATDVPNTKIVIDANYVENNLAKFAKIDDDNARFIL